MTTPLWQVLLKIQQSSTLVPLDCDECFVLLSFLAEQAVDDEAFFTLQETAYHHLRHCVACSHRYAQELANLTTYLSPDDLFYPWP